MIYLLVAVATLFQWAISQDANCDFAQNVQVGVTYSLYSPNYPNSYNPGSTCRWIATCPVGYNCVINCNVELPQSTSCSLDRLLVSNSGDPQLVAANQYCGTGTLNSRSTGRVISIGLITSRSSTGGRFLCQLTAEIDSTTVACSCGYKQTNRIVGGVETGLNEFPMMAGIVDASVVPTEIYCGGVIIARRYIMTAAHCLQGKSADTLAVTVGEHDITANVPSRQVLRVSQYVIHPNYNSDTYTNDIAILTLAGNITFNSRVGPVCLPYKFVNTDLSGDIVTVLGWGTLFFAGPTSETLQKVDLQVVNQATCRQTNPLLTASQICTYADGKDSCSMDSGGPVLYTDSTTGLLFSVGIVSSGSACAGPSPSLNTRVASFLSWISTVAPSDYCVK